MVGKKICLVGYGAMGRALFECWKEFDVVVVDPSKCEYCVDELTHSVDVLVYAVKPKVFPEIAAHYEKFLGSNSFVISIMAGVTLEQLASFHKKSTLIRVMPNLPVSLMEGVSTVIAAKNVDDEMVHQLLKATGTVVWLDQEEQLDQLTPLNGCGPGFLAAFCEALIKSYVRLGFPHELIELMVKKTLLGSALLFDEHVDVSIEGFKKKVATKGGVTEAGLLVLEKGLDGLVNATIDRAIEKIYEK